MAHSHHHHAPATYGRAFAIGIVLNLGFVILELIYGRLTHSLALVADAGHNFSDVLSLVLAWGASILSRRPASQQFTYGLRRTSIWAALINASLLLVALGGITWEAVGRFSNPQPVASGTVMIIAAIGIAINAFTAWLFFAGRSEDLNVRGAFLHLAADAVVSLGVVIAAGIMAYTGWNWLDPVVSLALVAVIFAGTWGLLREAVRLSLDAVPESVSLDNIRAYLVSLPAIAGVHDLHIWAMSTTEVALTAHLVTRDLTPDNDLVTRVSAELHDRFGIEHTTLQLETVAAAQACHLSDCSAPQAVVGELV